MPATRLRRSLYRTETIVGLAAGVVSGLRGIAYLPPYAPDEVPPSLSAFTNVLPLWIYAVLWIPILPMSIAAIWVRRLWVPTVSAMAGLCAFSGLLAVLSWLIDGSARGWMAALSYVLLAILIGGMARMAAVADGLVALVEAIIRGRE